MELVSIKLFKFLISSLINQQFHPCTIMFANNTLHTTRFQLQVLAQQVGRKVPIISCGLFPFDWTILYSVSLVNFSTGMPKCILLQMFAAMTTYLVILFQFDTSASAQKRECFCNCSNFIK